MSARTAADILEVFFARLSKKMWQFSIAKGNEQHSFLFRSWQGAFCVPVTPYLSSVGYCIVYFAMGSPQPSLRWTKLTPHFLFTTNPAIQESNGNIKLVAMTYYKDNLQVFLDDHIHEILGKLGREFDSNDFITAFRLLFPNEYATVLRRSSSYRAIHTWVARWYLSGRTDLLQKGDIRQRQSDNRNPTKNRTWIKL